MYSGNHLVTQPDSDLDLSAKFSISQECHCQGKFSSWLHLKGLSALCSSHHRLNPGSVPCAGSQEQHRQPLWGHGADHQQRQEPRSHQQLQLSPLSRQALQTGLTPCSHTINSRSLRHQCIKTIVLITGKTRERGRHCGTDTKSCYSARAQLRFIQLGSLDGCMTS